MKTLVLEVIPGGNQIDDACGTEQKSSRTGQLHSKRMQKVSVAAVACLLKAIFNSIRERVLMFNDISNDMQYLLLAPVKLIGYNTVLQVISLDIGGMVAGAKFRGALKPKLRSSLLLLSKLRLR